jgi:hypothetical protein
MKKLIIILIITKLLSPFHLSGQEGKLNNERIKTKIICVPDVQYYYQILDSNNCNQQTNTLLKEVEEQQPGFVVFGKILGKQLGDNPIRESIIYQTDNYYPLWNKMIQQFDFEYYTLIGPNILGGEEWHDHKSKIFDVYKKQYRKYIKMPQTGGFKGNGGIYYWIVRDNVLMVMLDAYNQAFINDSKIIPNIGSEQLKWLDNTLKYHQFITHKIIVSSSSKVLNTEPILMDILKKHKIDYFLSFDKSIFEEAEYKGIRLLNINADARFPDALQYLLLSIDESGIKIMKKDVSK